MILVVNMYPRVRWIVTRTAPYCGRTLQGSKAWSREKTSRDQQQTRLDMYFHNAETFPLIVNEILFQVFLIIFFLKMFFIA